MNIVELSHPDHIPRLRNIARSTQPGPLPGDIRAETLAWVAECPLPPSIKGARLAQAVAFASTDTLAGILDAHGLVGEEARAVAGWFAQMPHDAPFFVAGTILDPRMLAGIPESYP
jgi:hypothetical protein